MAKYVTRTVKFTEAKVLFASITDQTASITTVTLAGTYKDNDKLLKAVKKLMDTDSVKAVDIAEVKVLTQLRRMTEDFYLANSEPVEKIN